MKVNFMKGLLVSNSLTMTFRLETIFEDDCEVTFEKPVVKSVFLATNSGK